MKTPVNSILNALLLSTGLLLSSASIAQRAGQSTPYYEEKPFAVSIFPAATPSKMWVHIDKRLIDRPVHIELLNAKGQLLASEWYARKRPSVCTRFDLTDVGDGLYTFRITDGKQTQERTFRLATPGFEEQLPKRLITMN